MMKDLIIVSNPRTGSTFFANGFSAFSEFEVYGEIFNNNNAHGIEYRHDLREKFRGLLNENGDPEKMLANYVRANPLESLKMVRDYEAPKNTKAIIYKIFGWHLPRDTVSDLLNQAGVLQVRSQGTTIRDLAQCRYHRGQCFTRC
jgi:hypothetical protein